MPQQEAALSQSPEVSSRFTSEDKLGAVAALAPDIFTGRRFFVDIATSDTEKVTLTAAIRSDGKIIYKYKESAVVVRPDGTISRSDFDVPDDIGFESITWRPYIDRSPKDSQQDEINDEDAAVMLNYYYGRIARHAANHPEEPIETLRARYDIDCLTGNIASDGLRIASISKYVQQKFDIPGAQAAVLINYQGEFSTSFRGQIVLFGFNEDTPARAILDISVDEQSGNGLYEFIDPEGTLDTLISAALQRGIYLDPKGETYHGSRSYNDRRGPFIVLSKDPDDFTDGVIGDDESQLGKNGFHRVRSIMSPGEFGVVRGKLQKREAIIAATALAEPLSENGLFPDADPQEIARRLLALPEVPPLLDSSGSPTISATAGHIAFIGRSHEPTVTPSGAPTGNAEGQIGIGIDGKVVIVGLRKEDEAVNLARLDSEQPLTLQQRLNLQLTTDNPDITVPRPYLGVIFLGQGVTYFADFPAHAGAEALFPTAALSEPRRQDVFLIMSPESVYLTDTMGSDPEQPINALVLRSPEVAVATAILTKGNSLTINHFGLISPDTFEKVKNAIHVHAAGSHGAFGMTEKDFRELMKLHNKTKEEGQMNLGISWLVTAASEMDTLFGQQITAKDQHNLTTDYKYRLKFFGVNGVPATLAQNIPQGGMGVSDVEQRTSVEQFATDLSDFRVHIGSNNSSVGGLIAIAFPGNILHLYREEQGILYDIPNYYITLKNTLRVLNSTDKVLNQDQIKHTAIIRDEVTGIPLETDDVIFSNVDGNNQVTGEVIVHRDATTGEYINVATAETLSSLVEADIELELMYRYIHGEIDFVDPNRDHNFIVHPVTGANSVPRDLGIHELVTARDHARSAARHEYFKRNMSVAANLLEQQFGFNDPLLPDKLKRAYSLSEELKQRGIYGPVTLESGCISDFVIHPDGTMTMQLRFTDFIGEPGVIDRTVQMDIRNKTIAFQHIDTETVGRLFSKKTIQTAISEVNPLLTTLARQLFMDDQLNLTADEITSAYVRLHNKDGNMWIHNAEATQIAVRNGKQIEVFDYDDPDHVLVITNADTQYEFELVTDQALKQGQAVGMRDATYAESRFFTTEVIPWFSNPSMISSYDSTTIAAMKKRMEELQKKEREIGKALDAAKNKSNLWAARLFPEPNIFSNDRSRDALLAIAVAAALDEHNTTVTLISKGDIFHHPDNFRSGTFKVNTDTDITFGKRNSNKVIVHATANKGADSVVVVGLYTDSPRFNGIPKNAKTSEGRAYGIQNDPTTNRPQLVTTDVSYEHQGGVYVLSRKRTNVRDFMGNQGEPEHHSYREELRQLIDLDEIGSLIKKTEKEDPDRKALLGAMLGVDTRTLGKRKTIIDRLHDFYMEPFPQSGYATPRVNFPDQLVPTAG